MVPASSNNGSESSDKEVIFFWFKDSGIVDDDSFDNVVLRIFTENKVVEVVLHLDEKSDVYQSEPEPVPIGVHSGLLVLNHSTKYSLNEFEVFRNRNRVVLKVNSDILPTHDDGPSVVEDALSEGSRPSPSNSSAAANDANNNPPHFYSVSDEDFPSTTEDDDVISANYSSDEQVNVRKEGVANIFNSSSAAKPPDVDMSYEPPPRDSASPTNENELHLDLHNFDENLNKMVKKYSKPSANIEKSGDDVMTAGKSGRNRVPSGGSVEDVQMSPKAQAANTPGRSTPSTVIDRNLSSSGSSLRNLEGEEERIIELENVVSGLHRQMNEKDNDVLRLKKDLLEAQRVNRSLKGDAESLQQLDSELIKELKAENQKLKVQLSVVTNEQPQNRDVEARYEALFEELELQKQTVAVLQKENQDLNSKVESLTRALNQSKTFTPIEEEPHDEDEVPCNANSMPSFQEHPKPTSSPKQHQVELHPEDPTLENIENNHLNDPSLDASKENHQPNGYQPNHQMVTASDSDVMNGQKPSHGLDNIGPRKDLSGSAPDLTYTKANIKFLKERLGEWNEKNQMLHDRCSLLEAATICSESPSQVKTDSDSRGDDFVHGRRSGGDNLVEPQFKNLAQISASSDPLEKFRRDLLRDHASLVEETDREIDRVNGHLDGHRPTSYYPPISSAVSERDRGDPFMDQRRAALMELEQIRKNLANVKAGLKEDELKTRDFEWTRLRDNLDKLKKPSELFGSLVQTSEDRRREEMELQQQQHTDSCPPPPPQPRQSSSPPVVQVEEEDCSNPSIAYTDITYQHNKLKLQSPADSVVERKMDKFNGQSSFMPCSGSHYYNSSAGADGTESDSTEVLMNMNPCPEPTIIQEPCGRSEMSPKASVRATSVPMRGSGRRSPMKKQGSSSRPRSKKGKDRRRTKTSDVDTFTTELEDDDDDDDDSDATLVSDSGVGNDVIILSDPAAAAAGSRKRNPESLYEERLNKSYPSVTHRIMNGLRRGDVTASKHLTAGSSTFSEGFTEDTDDQDSSSSTSVDASTIITDEIWISEYLPKRKSRSRSSHKRTSGGVRGGGSQYESNLVAMVTKSPDLSSLRRKAGLSSKTGRVTSDHRSSPLKYTSNAPPPVSNNSTSGGKLKYYVPRVPSDVSRGDKVKFSRKGGKVSHGIIRYVGSLPGRTDFYLGVELESGEGKHDGSYNGRRYFSCPFRKGVFVSFSKIILCYGNL